MDRSDPRNLKQNAFESFIRIEGKPIVPPLVRERDRREINFYRQQAMLVEEKINQKRSSTFDSGIITNSNSDQTLNCTALSSVSAIGQYEKLTNNEEKSPFMSKASPKSCSSKSSVFEKDLPSSSHHLIEDFPISSVEQDGMLISQQSISVDDYPPWSTATVHCPSKFGREIIIGTGFVDKAAVYRYQCGVSERLGSSSYSDKEQEEIDDSLSETFVIAYHKVSECPQNTNSRQYNEQTKVSVENEYFSDVPVQDRLPDISSRKGKEKKRRGEIEVGTLEGCGDREINDHDIPDVSVSHSLKSDTDEKRHSAQSHNSEGGGSGSVKDGSSNTGTKLVRQRSYVLDHPSDALMAYVQANEMKNREEQKLCSTEPSFEVVSLDGVLPSSCQNGLDNAELNNEPWPSTSYNPKDGICSKKETRILQSSFGVKDIASVPPSDNPSPEKSVVSLCASNTLYSLCDEYSSAVSAYVTPSCDSEKEYQGEVPRCNIYELKKVFQALEQKHKEEMDTLLMRHKLEREDTIKRFCEYYSKMVKDIAFSTTPISEIQSECQSNVLDFDNYSECTAMYDAPHPVSSSKSLNVFHLDKQNQNRPHSNFTAERCGDYTAEQERAATIINAAVRGYLTRRLFRTMYVKDIKNIITTTVDCAMNLQKDWNGHPAEVELHKRLIQQVTSACTHLHDTFFLRTTQEKMALITEDRMLQSSQSSRRSSGTRCLSAATQKTLQRKQKIVEDQKLPSPTSHTTLDVPQRKQSSSSSGTKSKTKRCKSGRRRHEHSASRRPWY